MSDAAKPSPITARERPEQPQIETAEEAEE